MGLQIVMMLMLIILACNLQFSIKLKEGEQNCFYQVLQTQQKYSMDVTPRTSSLYEVSVFFSHEGQWSQTHFKSIITPFEAVNIHKLAAHDSTYSFCVKNIERQQLVALINLKSGLQLLDFQLLPDKSDSQNLERELLWLQEQQEKLFQSLGKIESLRVSTEGLANLMSTKIILFAILGLVTVVGVNLVFYYHLKRTFKERKLI